MLQRFKSSVLVKRCERRNYPCTFSVLKPLSRSIRMYWGLYLCRSVPGSCIITFPFTWACFVTGNPDSELGQSCLQETHRSDLADHNVLLRVEKKSTAVEHKLCFRGWAAIYLCLCTNYFIGLCHLFHHVLLGKTIRKLLPDVQNYIA